MKKNLLIISGSLHQIPVPPNGTGVARLVQHLAENLNEFDVRVLSFMKEIQPNYDEKKFIQIDPNSFQYRFYYRIVSSIPLWLNKKLWGRDNPRFIAYYLCFRSVLKKIRPKIIITTMHLDAFRMAYLQCPHAQHIFYFRSSDIYLEGFNKLKFLTSKASAVFTLTKESSDFLSNKFPFAQKKLFVIPNAIDLELFDAEKSAKTRLVNRKMYGVGENDFVLGYAGRLSLSKGVDHILECLINLQGEMKNLKLLIAGSQINETIPDPMFRKIIEKLMKAVEPDRIIFTGWLSRQEMITFYSSIDVSILLSKKREGHSMFGLESQACGVPVIATRIGGNPEIIQHGHSGFILTTEIKEELKDYIRKLYYNKDTLEAMSKSAVENVRHHFTYPLLLKRIRNVIDGI